MRDPRCRVRETPMYAQEKAVAFLVMYHLDDLLIFWAHMHMGSKMDASIKQE